MLRPRGGRGRGGKHGDCQQTGETENYLVNLKIFSEPKNIFTIPTSGAGVCSPQRVDVSLHLRDGVRGGGGGGVRRELHQAVGTNESAAYGHVTTFPTRAFSWLKAATTAFTFKTLC